MPEGFVALSSNQFLCSECGKLS